MPAWTVGPQLLLLRRWGIHLLLKCDPISMGCASGALKYLMGPQATATFCFLVPACKLQTLVLFTVYLVLLNINIVFCIVMLFGVTLLLHVAPRAVLMR